MDYEKEYKSLVAKVKKAHKFAKTDSTKSVLEDILPQLRESEDERIRKLLVWQVYRNIEDETNDLARSVYDGIKGHDPDIEESIEDWKKCLAYLEKQKEQKPNIELIQRSWYMEGYHDREFGKEPKWIIKTGEGGPKHELNPKYGQPLADEQKPAEWSEEDEEMRNLIVAIFEVNHPDGFFKANELGTTDMRGVHTEEIVSWLKSLHPQPNPEWSEEDEMYLSQAIETLEHENYLILADKLKSLRPSWKPFKDEERLINTSISFLKDFADKGYENAVECIDWLKSKLNGNTCE